MLLSLPMTKNWVFLNIHTNLVYIYTYVYKFVFSFTNSITVGAVRIWIGFECFAGAEETLKGNLVHVSQRWNFRLKQNLIEVEISAR